MAPPSDCKGREESGLPGESGTVVSGGALSTSGAENQEGKRLTEDLISIHSIVDSVKGTSGYLLMQ